MTVVCSGVAQALVLLGWSGYHGLDRSCYISYRDDDDGRASTGSACLRGSAATVLDMMRRDVWSAVVG